MRPPRLAAAVIACCAVTFGFMIAPSGAASARAAAATGTTCADWAPNAVNQLLCNLKLIGPPPAAPAPAPEPDPTPEPEPTPDPDPGDEGCGPTVPKAGGGTWTCTFADNFNGTSLDRSVWVPQTNFSSGSNTVYACYVDDPAVVSVSGGHLNLSVKKMATPVDCPGSLADSQYAAGQVSTFYTFSQQYGRFEAKMLVPAAAEPGLQEAFWLWPDVRYSSTATWPLSGEIDIVETYSQHPELAIPFLHYSADVLGPQPGLNTAWNCVAHRGAWNTYTLEWSANRLEVFVNGTSCLVNTSGDAAFKKRYIVALTQALGTGANSYDGTGLVPATTQVDYVRVWK